MKVGVSGASGHLGKAVIDYLKEKNAPSVVAISRTPETLSAPGVEARFGDYDQPESLLKAYAGLDRLLIIPSSNMDSAARAKQVRVAIESAVQAGVGHIVLLSVLGTRYAAAPHLWHPYFVSEETLTRVAKKWTILRMAYFAESFLDEVRMTLANGVHTGISAEPVNIVSRDDVGAAAGALLLLNDLPHGATFQATGPASLDGPARAAIIARATGKPFAFVQVTPEQLRAGLEGAQLPPILVDLLLSIQSMWQLGAFDVTTNDIERLSGRRPRTLEEVARAALV